MSAPNDASSLTLRRKQRTLFADRTRKETAFRNGLQIFVDLEYNSVQRGAITYTPTYYNMTTGALVTTSAERDAYIASVPTSVPGAPTITNVVGGDASVMISFTPSSQPVVSPVTRYRVTSTPSGITATGSSSPITVTGLTNGTSYTFRVVAINVNGSSAPSTASDSVTPTSPVIPSGYIELDPGNSLSYPGSGTTITSIGTSSGISGTMSNVTYNSASGGYLTFNGASSYISFPSYNFGSTITVSAWVRPVDEFSINTLMATASAGLSSAGIKLGWNSWQTNDKAMLFEGGSGSSGNASISQSSTIVNGAWQHITYVFDQATPSVSFYKNGVLLTSSATPVSGIPMISEWRIGDMFESYHMNADLGLFKIYPSLLSGSDILSEFNSTKARYGL